MNLTNSRRKPTTPTELQSGVFNSKNHQTESCGKLADKQHTYLSGTGDSGGDVGLPCLKEAPHISTTASHSAPITWTTQPGPTDLIRPSMEKAHPCDNGSPCGSAMVEADEYTRSRADSLSHFLNSDSAELASHGVIFYLLAKAFGINEPRHLVGDQNTHNS